MQLLILLYCNVSWFFGFFFRHGMGKIENSPFFSAFSFTVFGLFFNVAFGKILLSRRRIQEELTDAALEIPEYYFAPIHAYTDGNLCWDSAMEVNKTCDVFDGFRPERRGA